MDFLSAVLGPIRRARRGLQVGMLLGCAAAVGGPTQAQEFPTKTVTIVVPLAAGTGMDSVARLYARELEKTLGKPVIVENQPGAATMLGVTNVARSNPDGHTLVVATTSAMSINPVVYKKINYNPDADLTPVALYLKSPFILVVDPKLPITSMAEFVQKAKAATQPLTFSSPGQGVPQHLSMEYLKRKFDLQMTHVPYRNTPQSITDIVGGHVNAAFAEVGASLTLIQDGKLRALAVSSQVRLASLPDVPTVMEAANVPDFEAVSWHMLLAPSKTPAAIVDRLHQEIKRITTTEGFRKQVTVLGLSPLDSPSRDGIKSYLETEKQKWGTLVRSLGLEGSQ